MSRARKLTIAFLLCAVLAGICFGLYQWDNGHSARLREPIVRVHPNGTFDLPQWDKFNLTSHELSKFTEAQYSHRPPMHFVLETESDQLLEPLLSLFPLFPGSRPGFYQITSNGQRFDCHIYESGGCKCFGFEPRTTIDLRHKKRAHSASIINCDIAIQIDDRTTAGELFSALNPYLASNDTIIISSWGSDLEIGRLRDESDRHQSYYEDRNSGFFAKCQKITLQIKGWF